MNLLDISHICARYGVSGDGMVINGLSLKLDGGEFLGLIGPNGCGKSTLIRAVSGVLALSGGGIRLHGRELNSLSRKQIARQIAVLPQDTRCTFPFTVRELVTMGRYPHLGRFQSLGAADEDIVDEALSLTDTVHLSRRSILELSGGERQRAMIAQALAQRPQLLLLDEPTSHLDINHQVEVFDLLQRLNRERDLTIICVTHDLNYAAEYCDALLLMSEGVVFSYGCPGEVITAAAIEAVYGVEVAVDATTSPGRPRITPLSRLNRTSGAAPLTPP